MRINTIQGEPAPRTFPPKCPTLTPARIRSNALDCGTPSHIGHVSHNEPPHKPHRAHHCVTLWRNEPKTNAGTNVLERVRRRTRPRSRRAAHFLDKPSVSFGAERRSKIKGGKWGLAPRSESFHPDRNLSKISEDCKKRNSSYLSHCFIVGMKGFEPSTTWSQTRHSNRTELHPESLSVQKSGTKVRF